MTFIIETVACTGTNPCYLLSIMLFFLYRLRKYSS